MTPNELKQNRIKGFLDIAAKEFAAANTLGETLPEQAAYFLQQTVEKLIRAVLEALDVRMGVGHNLRTLAEQLPSGHFLISRFADFDDLSSASTKYRYPTNEGKVARFDARRVKPLIADVKALIDDVEQYIKGLD
jgi:HEPN domain-containing protein